MEVMRSGPGLETLEEEPAGSLLDVTGGVRGMRGVQYLWPETWKDGADLAETRRLQSSRLERERKRRMGFQGWGLMNFKMPVGPLGGDSE